MVVSVLYVCDRRWEKRHRIKAVVVKQSGENKALIKQKQYPNEIKEMFS